MNDNKSGLSSDTVVEHKTSSKTPTYVVEETKNTRFTNHGSDY